MTTARNVVITGAAGGISSEITDRFLRNGDTVLASDLHQETLDEWRTRWDSGAPNPSLHTFPADVADEASLADLVEAARDRLGTVDVLINAAGHFPQTPFEKISGEEWRRVVEVNLSGTFYTVQALLPLIKRSERGRIINIGSGGMFFGVPRQAHYIASKAGVMGLTRVLARELGNDYPITVNLVTPGLVVTPAAAAVLPEPLLAMQRNMRSFHRDEVPGDVVGSVFFLASDDAAFITGQTLNVDGGLTMW
ncbi:3-oxoacyl-[acyl-carrier protein] reductase [Lentzea xinjiangensis]|uniref:3-oxoacyl-[acyl-carrier protein] reductase n=1 Tax=Lentzea xinjiangensis TaxID=402600 RepID=A0A1H9NIN7_9PSEU|nr:SDR family oxidoreductase [Lentzea xinjiangensis]SER35529.1 3-oxoacyl-[acyl-carrier protein] reductase [Lentzea xinjiangensis]